MDRVCSFVLCRYNFFFPHKQRNSRQTQFELFIYCGWSYLWSWRNLLLKESMIPIVYILLNFLHAVWHYYLIKKNRLIKSGQKIIEYSVISILAGLILKIWFGWQLIPLILFCVLCRAAFFDAFLNLLRGKRFDYEGQISSKKSLWDWFENWVGLPVWFYRIIYLAAFVIYTIIYFLWN